MTSKLMSPPEDGSRNRVTVNGRVYESTPGVAISVPSFDAAVLEVNEWVLETTASGAQAANKIFAGPASGSNAVPGFRPLSVNDFNGGANASGSTAWFGDGTWKTPAGGGLSQAEVDAEIAIKTALTYGRAFNVRNPNYAGSVTAIGDNVANDGPALLEAVRAVYYAGGGTVFVPKGLYRVSAADANILANILTPNTNATGYAVAVNLVGEGQYSSIIRVDPTGSAADYWLFNNPTGFSTHIGSVFMDIGFQGGPPDGDGGWQYASIPQYANFCRLYGHNTNSVQTQRIQFIRVSARGFQKIFATEGNAVCSEITHHGCDYSFSGKSVYYLNNGQSVNHDFYGTKAELAYGHVVDIGPNGGGAVRYHGGSIIMMANGAAVNKALVNMDTAVASDPIEFWGVRPELRGNYSNLVKIVNLGHVRVVFNGGRILDEGAAAKTTWLQLGDNARVDLNGVTLEQQNGFATNVALNGTGLGGETGTVFFNGCSLPADFSDQCSINYVGNITARNTQGSVGQSGSAYAANDFTLNGLAALGKVTAWTSAGLSGDGGTSNLQPAPKWAYLKCWSDYWQTTVGGEQTLKLPKGAVIKSIHILFPGGGLSGGTGVFVRVTNNDYTVKHASLSVGTGGTAGETHLENIWYAVGSTANGRTLRLSLGADTASASSYAGITGSNGGGIVLVEYL